MAEIFIDVGIQHIQAIWPKNGTNDAVLYLGLFGGATTTSGTVPPHDATAGASPGGWTEVTGNGYARRVISAAQWGISAVTALGGNTGLKVTGLPQAWTATGTWMVCNGMFLASNTASVASDTAIWFANFDDLIAVTLNSGDTITVTPAMTFFG